MELDLPNNSDADTQTVGAGTVSKHFNIFTQRTNFMSKQTLTRSPKSNIKNNTLLNTCNQLNQ